ncbi:MAG: DUF302 domain-containing protein [Methylobacteriaceae bacterium]|nr:DUF302 domain-containing protein [Methylobacteriaceae bacterium]
MIALTSSRRLRLAALAVAAIATGAASAAAQTAQTIAPRAGWSVTATPHAFAEAVRKLEEAVKANKMGLVTAASASEGAKAQGIAIPGNRVVGVFRNDFARRMLAASLPAGIEAPIRFYVTEGADGKATISYKTPGAVFAPYLDGAGADLKKVAEELDPIFAAIAAEAAKP